MGVTACGTAAVFDNKTGKSEIYGVVLIYFYRHTREKRYD